MLKKGSVGEKVKWLQQKINDFGFGPLKIDGDFGNITRSAVRKLQRALGLNVDGIVGPKTEAVLEAPPKKESVSSVDETVALFIQVFKDKGYDLYDDGRINTIGVRSAIIESNSFDDHIYLLWKEEDWVIKKYRATTDPGIFWLAHPSKVEGTAILVPGQYKSHKLGLHQGRYKALVQHMNEVSVWRDPNRNAILDRSGQIYKGYFGINIHHAGTNSTQVDKWSAGCQVFARMVDWNEAMSYWESSNQEVYPYTLLEEDVLK